MKVFKRAYAKQNHLRHRYNGFVMLKHAIPLHQFQHKLWKKPCTEHFRGLRMSCCPTTFSTACLHSQRMSGVDPQRRCHRGACGMYYVDQLITGSFLKLWIINLFPHPQVPNCGIASHPALYKIAWRESILSSCDFRQGDIRIDTHILSAHLFSKRGGKKSRNLFGV